MMVRKKNRWLTHVLLTLLVVVVLFPIVWVVSTSFRRDEAAFSPKLFSSRLTIQHYKDLVAPEKNLPVLIQEMQSLVSRVKPFDNVSREKADRLVEDRIRRFENYLAETKKLLEDVNARNSKIEEALSQKFSDVLSYTKDVLEEAKKLTQEQMDKTPLPDSQRIAVALYERLKGKSFRSAEFQALKDVIEKVVGYSVENQDTLNDALSELGLVYEKEVGTFMREIEKLNGEIETLQREIATLKKQKETLEKEILEKQKVLEVLKPDIDSVSEVLVKLKDMVHSVRNSKVETAFPYEDSKLKSSLEKLLSELNTLYNKISAFSDLSDLSEKIFAMKSSLEEINNVVSEDGDISKKALYGSFVQSFEETVPIVEGIVEKVSDGIDDFVQKIKDLKNIENEFIVLEAKLDGLEKSLNNVRSSLSEKEKEISSAKMYLDLKIFNHQIQSRIDSLEDMKSFNSAAQIKLLSIYNTLKDFVSSYVSEYGGDDFIGKIRKLAAKLSWIEDYRDLNRRVETGYKNAVEIVEKAQNILDDFKGSYSNLLDLSFKGLYVSSEHLEMLYDLVKMNFVQEVLTNTAVASRKAGTLMDTIPLKELKSDLKKIDGDLYRLAQIWEQKTKHYFLRWVMNSVIVAGLVSLITTAVCALAAYPFSRMRFWGRQYGIMALLLIQMFPAIMYMVAIYGLLKLIGQFLPFLGLDSLGGLIFAYLGNIAYNMYLIKGFYDTIPSSLEEAAMIDGATRFQTFYKIVVPLALPILTVIVILTFIGTFNEFVLARIILQDVKNYTYALGLWTFSTGAYETEWGLFTAAALLGMTPMVILFLSLQKYIVGGLTKGSVKG